MLKWTKKYAGCYKTKCGRFEVRCNWYDLNGRDVYWTLHCVDYKVTLDGRVWGTIDAFNTKREAQEASAWCDEDMNIEIREPRGYWDTDAMEAA